MSIYNESSSHIPVHVVDCCFMASSSADIPFAAAQEMFPAGVVFDPDDEELVFYYLMGKEVYGFSDEGGFRFIRVIKLYDCKPSMLSGK